MHHPPQTASNNNHHFIVRAQRKEIGSEFVSCNNRDDRQTIDLRDSLDESWGQLDYFTGDLDFHRSSARKRSL